MDNDNTLPVLVAGKLSKECYSTAQELVDELPSVLKIPFDTIQVIKGAQGEPGRRGRRGEKGETGSRGPKGDSGITLQIQIIAIPEGATYVEFDYFTNWRQCSYSIVHLGTQGGGSPLFDPAEGIVSVGTLVEVYDAEETTKVRCYFTFHNCSAVPDANHRLHITLPT